MDDIGDALQGVTHNDEEAPPDLNISEVLHAISIADPTFGVGVEEMYRQPAVPPPSAPQPSGAPKMPYVRIIEQPAGKSLRFRYECEGRSAGSIPGVHSTPEKKTYPTIEVVGYTGRFVVLVSCVTRDKPYRPHPHNLVGREPLCNRGVCTVECNADTSIVQFSNLGIQCVKRKDIAEALRVREEIKVDPFKTGFSHKNQPQNIDLNAVRLCFQVYIPGGNTSKIKQALIPVVSDVIYDKKAMCELQINRLSTCAASVRGGTELILLCEKVTRDDVDVVFSQAFDDGSLWEASANIVLVHKQVAIAFQAPPYRDPMCIENVKVKIFLKRVSDGARSAPVDFEYTPDYADSDYLSNKKRKTAQNIDSFLATYKQDIGFHESAIKKEPRDTSPALQVHSPPMAGVGSPHYPPHYRDPADPYQQWMPSDPNLGVPNTNPFLPHAGDPRGYWGPQNFAQTSPTPNHAVSPNMLGLGDAMSPQHRLSPNMQNMSGSSMAMNPNMVQMSPLQGSLSPAHQPSPMLHTSPPHMQSMMSPLQGSLSPVHQPSPMLHTSPPHMQSMVGHTVERAGPSMMNPSMVQMLPLQGSLSPAHQPSPMLHTSPPHMQSMQHAGQAQDLGAGAPLDSDMQFNSADLSGIIATLGPPELSDSLRALSTSELIPTMQPM
ncbi:transcription factor p65 isoform X5 [Cydia pomonella]|uniref:transcription factor p65 isoform X5 n=1 Tax=Cydia pomonella TaxID=82600 RepID=UPI002ADD8995|nr:transcription factor p65 isoform X5 [Cydia pomonella]